MARWMRQNIEASDVPEEPAGPSQIISSVTTCEAAMSHWRATIPTDIQHEDEIGYYGGWTISGLAVLATVTAVWVFGV